MSSTDCDHDAGTSADSGTVAVDDDDITEKSQPKAQEVVAYLSQTAQGEKVKFEPVVQFSAGALCASVLSLDLAQEYNKTFCKESLKLISKGFGVSESTLNQIHETFCKEGQIEDLPKFISAIKDSAAVCEAGGPQLIPFELVVIFSSTGCYDARARVLIRHVSALLGVDWEMVRKFEDEFAEFLEHEIREETEEESAARLKKERNRKIRRYAMIGAGGALGGVFVGLTGGLAAPLFAAGAGAFIGTTAAAGIATTAGAAVLGSLFGVAGAGLTGYKVSRRVGALNEFSIEVLSPGKGLSVTMAISGWISEDREDAFTWAWRHLDNSREQYCLRYESKYLVELGNAMSYLSSFAVYYGVQSYLMQTALAGLVTAAAWPMAIVSTGTVVDNPWNVSMSRAKEAGLHLAQLLITRQQGQRPITLMGFSLGARVIYHCLLEMAAQGQKSMGIVEDVVLLGAPVSGSSSEWRRLCQVVSGRIINGYSRKDWILSFLYRTMNAQFSVAGVSPILEPDSKIVNVNLTDLVEGHLDYQNKTTAVLRLVGIQTGGIISPSGSSAQASSSALSTPTKSSVANTFPVELTNAPEDVEKATEA